MQRLRTVTSLDVSAVAGHHAMLAALLLTKWVSVDITCSFCIAYDRLYLNIYILGVFTEKPYSKILERHVVNIPITTSGHSTSVTSK